MNFKKALKSIETIKLTGGIFGKTTLLLVVLCVCVAAVSLKNSTWWLALILMLPLMGIVFYSLKRCLDFAESNPQAAIMDGAEFLVHERIVHGRKGEEEIPFIEVTTDHKLPNISDAEVKSEDPLPTEALDSKPSQSKGDE